MLIVSFTFGERFQLPRQNLSLSVLDWVFLHGGNLFSIENFTRCLLMYLDVGSLWEIRVETLVSVPRL